MATFIIVCLIVGSIVWVYFDAKSRPKKVSLEEGEEPDISLPRNWVIGCALLWIVFFPWYLIHREKVRRGSGISVATVVGSIFVIVVFSVAILPLIISYYSPAATESPKIASVSTDEASNASAPPAEAPESEQSYKASAVPLRFVRSGKGIYYKEFLKNPNKFAGKRIFVIGKIMQIEENTGSTFLQMYITQISLDSVIAESNESLPVYKDDIVDFYGEVVGVKEGPNAFGATMTWPLLRAKYVTKHRRRYADDEQ